MTLSVLEPSERIYPRMVELRRTPHQYPQPAFEEEITAHCGLHLAHLVSIGTLSCACLVLH